MIDAISKHMTTQQTSMVCTNIHFLHQKILHSMRKCFPYKSDYFVMLGLSSELTVHGHADGGPSCKIIHIIIPGGILVAH